MSSVIVSGQAAQAAPAQGQQGEGGAQPAPAAGAPLAVALPQGQIGAFVLTGIGAFTPTFGGSVPALGLARKSPADQIKVERAFEGHLQQTPLWADAQVQGTFGVWQDRTNALEKVLANVTQLEQLLAQQRKQLPVLEREFQQAGRSFAGAMFTAAKGDEGLLALAGMQMRRVNRPALAAPLAPADVTLALGKQTGWVVPDWGKVKHALHFVLQFAPDAAAGPWVTLENRARRRRMLKGLPPQQKAWVRIAAVGAAGVSPWSEPVGIMVR
jgi:hypothetical protein